MKYKELLQWGENELTGEDAVIDARLLLEHVCKTNLQTLLLDPGRPISDEEKREYLLLLQRRKEHEPLAMILGEWDFMGLTFKVTKDVLIPEQDTEHLAEKAIEIIGQRPGPQKLLDMCTGSGCILLSILYHSKERFGEEKLTGIGCDLSEGALAVAKENSSRLLLDDSCHFSQGDLFDAIPNESGNFDLIVSNPPYIARKVIPTLPIEVRCGEPYMALCGGEDGLDFYRRIIPRAREYLKDDGVLLLEIGYDQGLSVPALMREYDYADIQVLKDFGGNDRVVIGRREVRV